MLQLQQHKIITKITLKQKAIKNGKLLYLHYEYFKKRSNYQDYVVINTIHFQPFDLV